MKRASKRFYGRHTRYVKGRRRHRPALMRWILSGVLLLAGVYVLLLIVSPNLPSNIPLPGGTRSPAIPKTQESIVENRLYIPKIDVNIGYSPGDARVLHDKAWHRFPERGDPKNGGNFILAAHRFEIGFWPGETRRKSPFYRLNLLESGDAVYVDYEGIRYRYEVVKRYRVEPDAVSIEDPSPGVEKMTLYSCTLKGAKDGREVVEAVLTTANVDPARPLDGH